jgi:hypothetical protein
MMRFLTCIGLRDSVGQMMREWSYKDAAETTISKHARGMLARKELEARRRQSADRVAARQDIRRTLKKASRRGYGIYSTRIVYLSQDESSLVYAKVGTHDVEKTLPFAQMERPALAGSVVTLTMRNQAKATATYKFQAATDAEAKVWARAVEVFIPARYGAHKAAGGGRPAAAVAAPAA